VVHVLDSGLPDVVGEVVWFAAIGLAGTGISLLVSLVVNRVFKKALTGLHPTRLLSVLTVVEVLAVGAFALSGEFWLVLAMLWVRSSVQVVAEPVVAAWMNRNLDSGVRATVLSFDGQMNAIGQMVGGPALGAVGNAVSVRAALLGSALILLPAAGVYAATRDRSETPAATAA
jgi:MFS transporter, DHA3 family, tetracycline resistance protein